MIKLTNGEKWVEVSEQELENWLEQEYEYVPKDPKYKPYSRRCVCDGRYGADGEYTLESDTPDIGWPFEADEVVWTEERWKKSGRKKWQTAKQREIRLAKVEQLEALGIRIRPVVDRIKNDELDCLLDSIFEKLP